MKKIILYPLYVIILLFLLYFDNAINLFMTAISYIFAPIKCSGILLFAIGITLIILIEILRYKYPIHTHKTKIPSPSTMPLYSDQPTSDDKYGRDMHAKILIQKIFSTFNDCKSNKGSFVININEAYGTGKTSFLRIFEKQLNKSSLPNLYIDYRPWLCENEQAIVKEFFTLLANKLGDYSLNDDIIQYMTNLMDVSSQIAPWWAKIPLSFTAQSIKLRPLKEIHDAIKDELLSIDKPIIVTIDDVDRLQEKELTSVLKLIRDTADFPNIFYILAADNCHLETMLKNQGIEQPQKFLQKFFNLDLLLPAHESVPTHRLFEEMKSILQTYDYPDEVITPSLMSLRHLLHLPKVFSNMRDVYRFLNIYTTSLDLLRTNDSLYLIDPYELFCLTIIRHLCPSIYKILRERNDEFFHVVKDHQDECFKLKDEINRELLIRLEKIDYHLKETEYQKDPKNNEKPEKPKPRSEELTLDTAIQKTEVTSDMIVFYLLDLLFHDLTKRDERSICRCSVYFIYFSGKVESSKLTTAQVIDIIKMDSDSYDSRMDQLFREGKNTSFISNFEYAFPRSGISRPDAMEKAYIYLKKEYIYTEDINHELFETFENYINSYSQSFMYFLYGLYGKNHNSDIQLYTKELQHQLEEYCQKKNDINMLVLAFYEFSQRLSDFCFDRDFVNEMLCFLGDRLINEQMEGRTFSQVNEPTYDTIYLLRDEFVTKKQWAEKFEKFLCQNKSRLRQWLGSIIRFYPNNAFDWNKRHKNAVIGEYFNSSEDMLNRIKQKFPDYSEVIEEIKHFQQFDSLVGQSSKSSKLIQMAREIQLGK